MKFFLKVFYFAVLLYLNIEVASFLCVCLEGEETLKCCVDQHPCFKTVSNNNDAQKCDFFAFGNNYSLGANLVQKLKMPV